MSSSRSRSNRQPVSAPVAEIEPVTDEQPEPVTDDVQPVAEPVADENAPAVSETETDPLTPATAAPKFNVKREIIARMIALVADTENYELLLADLTPEQREAAELFIANYFSYGPGVQSSKTAWPENFKPITALKSSSK
jgi:hypothetical protein